MTSKIIVTVGILDGTLEQILSGYQTFRNPGLVRVLDKFNYIENYGKGLKRIIEAYQDSGKKPIFDVNNTYFKVILPNLNYDGKNENFSTVNSENSTVNLENSTVNTENSTVNPQNSTVNLFLQHLDTFEKLTNTELNIIKLILSNNKITINQISEILDKHITTIKKAIKHLQDINILERVGSDKTGQWKILNVSNDKN